MCDDINVKIIEEVFPILITSEEPINLQLIGEVGASGQGIASGGKIGQTLVKKSNIDYDTDWANFIDSAEADINILKGQVLNLKSTGHIGLAQANNITTSNVCGLAFSDCLATVSCLFISNSSLTLSDWTNIVGTTSLNIGATYYLSSDIAGMLTINSPITVGQYVIKVGLAVASDTLEINIEQKILL